VTCPSETELVAFLQRELAPAEAGSVEEHFGTCDDCRHLVFALAVEGTQPPAERGPAVAIGEAIDRFTIEERLAAGGMGVVYRAHDPTLRRDVALKLVHLGSSLAQADAQERLLREAQGLARLDHPNVVTVYEAGTHGREVFIAMELVDGVSLDRWLADAPRDRRAIAAMLEQAGRGLAAAHAAGLVHRDFKPANVMVGTDGRVKVVDFGLARALVELASHASGAAPVLDAGSAPDDLRARLTLTGALVGTPAYCAPEQLVGEQVDIRSDVFSFCVTFCEAVSGKRPFTAPTAGDLVRRMKDPPDLPATLPKRLLALLRRGLAVDPLQRLPSLAPILEELARRPRRKLPPLIAGGVVLAAAIPLTLLALRDAGDPCGGSRAEIAGTWSLARRAQIEHAILGTQLPFAGDTWQRVEASLDAYATRWTGMHTETCRATAVHHTQSSELLDRRMACLAGARSQLDASIATLTEVDRTRVRSAQRVVEGLPSLDACTATATLLAVTPVPTGRELDVDRVRAENALASAAYRAGAYTQAEALAQRAATEAEKVGYRPLIGAAFQTLGKIQSQLQQRAQARTNFEHAVDEAAASGDAELEASALADLSDLVRHESADGQLANTFSRHAVAIVERIHGSPSLAAKVRLANARSMLMIDNTAAKAQLALGLAELARADEAEPEGHHEMHVDYELVRLSFLDESEAVAPGLRKLLADTERYFGANHPNVAVILNELVDNATLWEARDEARAYASRIAQIMAPYPGHESVVRRLDASLEPDPVKRRPILEQVVRDAEVLYGPTSPMVASALDDLAVNYDELGDQLGARPLIERAIQIWEGAYGSDFELLVGAYGTKVTVYERTDLATAAIAAEHAVKLSQLPGVRDVTKFQVKLMLGELYFRQGRYADTLKIIADVRPLFAMLIEPDDPLLMTIDFVEAACHYELGHEKPAQLRKARELYTKYRALRGAEDPQTIKDQAGWLADKR